MKKIILLATILLATVSFSQRIGKGEKQVNAGLFLNSGDGMPIYVGMDFGVHPDITVGGQIEFSTYSKSHQIGSNTMKTSNTVIGISANGNYHFNRILEIPNNWDFYAGLTLAYNTGTSKTTYGGETTSNQNNYGPYLVSQIGGRYFFTDNFGVNLEFGYRTIGSGAKLGITYKL